MRRFTYRVLHAGLVASFVSRDGDAFTVEAESNDGDGREVTGDQLLLAIGRRPYTDTLRVGEGTVSEIADAIHIRPAPNEVVQRACNDV